MTKNKWTIYWNEGISNTYTYGSKIRFLEDKSVDFDNRLMPPGTVIKEWYSKTNFQAQRIEPTLPLIDGESAYHILVNMDYEQVDDSEIMLRVIYYDRYDAEAESIILRGGSNYIKPPITTYSFKIQLVNGGITKFVFHSFVLSEVSQEEFDADQERIKQIKEDSKEGKKRRRKNKKSK